MSQQQSVAIHPDVLQDFFLHYATPSWLRDGREVAWSEYENMPVPKLEATNLTSRAWDIEQIYSYPADSAENLLPDAKACVDASCPYVYVQDGKALAVHLPESLASQGIIFTDLQTAAIEHPALVEKYLGSVVASDEYKWTALSSALWQNGVFLYIPRNTAAESVFQFVYAGTPQGGGALPRCLVIADENAQLRYSELYYQTEGLGQGTVNAPVTEIIAMQNAHVEVSAIYHLLSGPTNYVTSRAALEANAHVDFVYGSVGDGFTVGLIECELNGDGATATAKAVDLGYRKQHMDLTVSMIHSGKFSESNIDLHGVVRDNANAVYRTSTHILDGAVSAGSEQSDKVVLMDKTVRAEAIPMLLIDEDDVERCGHGATVGKIDPDQVYYLMSRGISRSEAEQMLIWGHLRKTVSAIPIEAVQTLFSRWIDEQLMR